MIKFIKWIFSPSKKQIVEEHLDFYSKIIDMEEKYKFLLVDIKRLEEENVEINNMLYELMNSIDAVDSRIDILTSENWIDKNV